MRVILCTAPMDRAAELAKYLVTNRLAACVSVAPKLTSFFWWEGAVQTETEALLIVKTPASRVAALTEALVRAHPYEVPEVISIPLAPGEGNARYLDWVRAETVAPDPPDAAPPGTEPPGAEA